MGAGGGPPARRDLGFVRVAAVSPEVRVADVAANVAAIERALDAAAAAGVQLAVFPEMCLTGYSCGDLFLQPRLQEAAEEGVGILARAAGERAVVAIVGFPLPADGRLMNCAALLSGGRVLGVVPKSLLPNQAEYYERRWFVPGPDVRGRTAAVAGDEVPFGVDLLFRTGDHPGVAVGIEICEDLWAVKPPSGDLALAGATLLANPSASNELLAKADYRRDLVRQQSARCLAAYVYAGAGGGESTTDTVWSGHSLVAENGILLAETERFGEAARMAVADVDVMRLARERIANTSYGAQRPALDYRTVPFSLPGADAPGPRTLAGRRLSPTPFVPSDPERRGQHCEEILDLQVSGLAKRLRHTGIEKVTIGLSGGLDSTLALLVAVRAFERLELPREGILAVSMPGFGTSRRTRGNAEKLAEQLDVTLSSIPILDAVRSHFRDIGHDEADHDVTYENAQARERTQILMDLANARGALHVGTGDLSELALGWCTYNADHMSMYHVNAGVPKTLVRYLVDWAADAWFGGEGAAVLHDISSTPVTPELLPLDEEGNLEQRTEDEIGPYDLNDFFLFEVVRHGSPPRKVLHLAALAFGGRYGEDEIRSRLGDFYRRFFANQFKRSAMPDGPKVGSVALSPRADWRMPSDAEAAAWLAQLGEGDGPAD